MDYYIFREGSKDSKILTRTHWLDLRVIPLGVKVSHFEDFWKRGVVAILKCLEILGISMSFKLVIIRSHTS